MSWILYVQLCSHLEIVYHYITVGFIYLLGKVLPYVWLWNSFVLKLVQITHVRESKHVFLQFQQKAIFKNHYSWIVLCVYYESKINVKIHRLSENLRFQIKGSSYNQILIWYHIFIIKDFMSTVLCLNVSNICLM